MRYAMKRKETHQNLTVIDWAARSFEQNENGPIMQFKPDLMKSAIMKSRDIITEIHKKLVQSRRLILIRG